MLTMNIYFAIVILTKEFHVRKLLIINRVQGIFYHMKLYGESNYSTNHGSMKRIQTKSAGPYW